MLKLKTSNLEGPALDWAVAKCEGSLDTKPTRCFDCKYYEERHGADNKLQYCHHPKMDFLDGSEAIVEWDSDFQTHEQCPITTLTPEPYSTDWTQAGPILQRERIRLVPFPPTRAAEGWWAGADYTSGASLGCSGPTPLIAAMRCYVVSKLGNGVEVPEDLVSM